MLLICVFIWWVCFVFCLLGSYRGVWIWFAAGKVHMGELGSQGGSSGKEKKVERNALNFINIFTNV